MDLSRPELSYVFLIIPLLFASAILFEGVVKLSKQEGDGGVAVGFGLVLFVLIGVCWFLFIR